MHITSVVSALAGIWLGALVAIDLIETPAKFTLKGLDRATAVALGRVVFRRLGFLEMALGAALLAAGWRSGGGVVALAAPLWLITLALCLGLRPSLEVRMRGSADQVPQQERGKRALRRLHQLYVAADGAKMLLLVALLILTARF